MSLSHQTESSYNQLQIVGREIQLIESFSPHSANKQLRKSKYIGNSVYAADSSSAKGIISLVLLAMQRQLIFVLLASLKKLTGLRE